jgi:hypothetical protein
VRYVPAKGTWGILVCLTNDCFSILSWQDFQFATAGMVKNNSDDFICILVVIYGFPYEESKVEFRKLHSPCNENMWSSLGTHPSLHHYSILTTSPRRCSLPPRTGGPRPPTRSRTSPQPLSSNALCRCHLHRAHQSLRHR